MDLLKKRSLHFGLKQGAQYLIDIVVLSLCLALAYLIRFEGLPEHPIYYKQFGFVLPYFLVLRLGLLTAFGVYRLVWQYVALRDLPRIIVAHAVGSAVFLLLRFTLRPALLALNVDLNPYVATVPIGVLAAEFILSTGAVISLRTLYRMKQERAKRRASAAAADAAVANGEPRRPRRRALLIGAGSAGVMVAREVQANREVGFEVCGFIDDDPRKQNALICGYQVLGSSAELGKVAAEVEADLAVITMANVPPATIRRLVDLAKEASLRVQIIPGLYEILSGRVNISKIRDVEIVDLLKRDPVHLDEEEIAAFLTHKVVLVSGAGGSIGSEICRQVCRYQPAQLVLLDQAENPLFHIHRELLRVFPEVPLTPVIANVVDRNRLRRVFAERSPEVVFHAAAHKHVPLMEANPGEAIVNNVGGSRNMADLAQESGADAFVMISTDKAVNPTSVMGTTKRLAEMYVQALAHMDHHTAGGDGGVAPASAQGGGTTRFITVRFGNVLGSEGSVVPIFKEQIKKGGPVTVTHPEMKRYFMTIPEASQLVLQAATMGEGGEIFILDMGEPVRIVDLARDLIRLSGFEPDREIAVTFSGMRPGEKLYEEINLSEENAQKTRHPRIWIGTGRVTDHAAMLAEVEGLIALVQKGAIDEARAGLHRLVPEYSSPK